jgi:hypothetical protein
VSALLAPFLFDEGTVSTDEVVFEPTHLLQLISRNSIQVEKFRELNIRAEGMREIAELLEAALSDWVDFVFLPSPELFVIYADHDEYTTFYSNDEPLLMNLARGLSDAGFRPIENYVRKQLGNKPIIPTP